MFKKLNKPYYLYIQSNKFCEGINFIISSNERVINSLIRKGLKGLYCKQHILYYCTYINVLNSGVSSTNWGNIVRCKLQLIRVNSKWSSSYALLHDGTHYTSLTWITILFRMNHYISLKTTRKGKHNFHIWDCKKSSTPKYCALYQQFPYGMCTPHNVVGVTM